MEELFNVIKDFLLNQFNAVLPDYEDQETTLPVLTEKQIVFGNIDPLKYTQDVVVSVLPEYQETESEDMTSYTLASNFTVTFVFRNADYKTLIKRMCRYASAFKSIVSENYGFNGEVENSDIGTIRFYSDCGIAEKVMTASEIDLKLYTSEEY